MAAKAKAPVKSKKAGVAKKTTAAKARPKGLQLSAAQWKAYNKAYAATAQKVRKQLALNAYANAFRKYRLNSAYATLKKFAVSRELVRAASVAAVASRRSWLQARAGHQEGGLRTRVELDMYKHANLLGRAQFARAGEAAYAHKAVMRTVDEAQAMSHTIALFRQLSRTARKAGKTKRTGPKTARSKAINKAANAAGLAAAKGVKPGTGAPRGRPKGSKAKAPKPKAAKQAKPVRGKGASAKAPVAKAKARTAPAAWGVMMGAPAPKGPIEWVGDETSPYCVIFAVANHVQKNRSITITPKLLNELIDACPAEPCIEQVLYTCWNLGWPYKAHLADYTEVILRDKAFALSDEQNVVIGYHTEAGDHAALLLKDSRIVSWGAEQDIDPETLIEEAWELRWDT